MPRISAKKLALQKEADEKNKTLTLDSILPTKHIKPNNKLANNITLDMIGEGEFNLIVSNKNIKNKIITTAMLNLVDDENIKLTGKISFTAYDREVHDAVVSLYVVGNRAMTAEMVYRAMNGNIESDHVSKQAVSAVKKSLEKSRRIMATIDYTQEAQAYNKEIEETYYNGYLLSSNKITIVAGGHKVEAYEILCKPILLQYAEVSGQIISVPIKLLQTKEAVRSTDEVIVIRGYLLRQIEIMKHGRSKRSKTILYENIYKELGINSKEYSDKAYKEKTFKIRKFVDAILNKWTSQEYIQGFNKIKEALSYKSIQIILNEQTAHTPTSANR